MRRLVLIEFTTATEKRAVGDQLSVDKGSAASFCDRLKVAERVGQAAPAVPPPPAPVVDVEPVVFPPADADI
jgi:hypothetical protein